MDCTKMIEIIKQVAAEHGYRIEGSEVYIERYNAVAYQLQENNSGYIQVHQWEFIDGDGNGRYGRAVYSLRNNSDVVQFCNILIASVAVRARR